MLHISDPPLHLLLLVICGFSVICTFTRKWAPVIGRKKKKSVIDVVAWLGVPVNVLWLWIPPRPLSWLHDRMIHSRKQFYCKIPISTAKLTDRAKRKSQFNWSVRSALDPLVWGTGSDFRSKVFRFEGSRLWFPAQACKRIVSYLKNYLSLFS